MPYRFLSTASGPLAELLGRLNLPVSLRSASSEAHHLWLLADSKDGEQPTWVLLPQQAAAATEFFQPRFQSIDDWLPGMTVMFDRRMQVSANATAEVSALWTSLATPFKNVIAGDIGLDLDLGLRASAAWQAHGQYLWIVERPIDAPRTLHVRLAAANNKERKITVSGNAIVGLDQASRNALAALAGRHRNQLLGRLRKNLAETVQDASRKRIDAFLKRWDKLTPAAQAALWNEATDPVVRLIQAHLEQLPGAALEIADQLTARLEHTALRLIEKRVSASLTATFEKWESSEGLLDASFDFDYPGIQSIFDAVLAGNLDAAINSRHPGVRVNRGVIATELTRRQTFEWRLPWTGSAATAEVRLRSAIEALDVETGRIVRGSAKAESLRRTRNAASLLQLEGAFASLLSDEVIVHNPASLRGRFEMRIRTSRPARLRPLLSLYGLTVPPDAGRECRIAMELPPESLAQWFQPRSLYDVSRGVQTAWRALLPAIVDFDSLPAESAAPILVWASLPVTAGARRVHGNLRLNLDGQIYWDHFQPTLKEAMVWNPLTKAALEQRLKDTHLGIDPDEARRSLRKPLPSALFQGLLYSEAEIVDRVCSTVMRANRFSQYREANPAESMRNFGLLLAGLVDTFHRRLSSVYGDDAARALGPLLLTAASPIKPEVQVEWAS